MEAKLTPSLPPSGQFTYRDQYDTIYEVSWHTTLGPGRGVGQLDITTVIKQPYVWGQPDSGVVHDHTLFRRGIVTAHRQVLSLHQSGYMIVSEGTDQSIQLFQASFPCGPQPGNPFLYHLNSRVVDELDARVVDGPRWADPASDGDAALTWDGLQFMDVWH